MLFKNKRKKPFKLTCAKSFIIAAVCAAAGGYLEELADKIFAYDVPIGTITTATKTTILYGTSNLQKILIDICDLVRLICLIAVFVFLNMGFILLLNKRNPPE